MYRTLGGEQTYKINNHIQTPQKKRIGIAKMRMEKSN
jgi:hypothetical protein